MAYRVKLAEPTPSLPQVRRRKPVVGFVTGSGGHGTVLQRPLEQPATNSNVGTEFQIVKAPATKYERLARYELLVGTEDKLPGFLGDITLRLGRDNVNTERLQGGVLNLCANHNLADPIGRVSQFQFGNRELRATVELATTRRGREMLEEVEQGLHLGVSPAFIINSFERDEDGDSFDIIVNDLTIFEISLTSGARNFRTRIERKLSMNNLTSLEGFANAPQVVSTSDMMGLSLTAMRLALTQGKIADPHKRQMIEKFFAEFDLRIGRGESRTAAAEAARDIAGIPARS